MQTTIITLTKEEFANLQPKNNIVVVECVIPKDEKTSGGIIIPKDNDFFTAHSMHTVDNHDHTAHMDRYGVVNRVPERLFFHSGKKPLYQGQFDYEASYMRWETEIEIQVGDIVWFDYYHGMECDQVQVEDKFYRLINYEYLIVAKRRSIVDPTTAIEENGVIVIEGKPEPFTMKHAIEDTFNYGRCIVKDDIICLNGYCLFEQISELPKTSLILLDKHIDKQKAVVKYMGSKNKSYRNKRKYDDVELSVGYVVAFRKEAGEAEKLLENELHYKFDTIPLRYAQRCDVYAILT